MADKRKSENYDALGGIFDFLFAEAKRPPDKRRPIKTDKLPGDSGGYLTDAITDSLLRPGAIMTETVVDELNDSLDIELATVKFNEDGNLKFTTKGLVDLIKDPADYVQKAINTQKTLRKAGRAAFLGSFMMDYVTTGWAQKYGNAEIKRVAVANTIANEEIDKYKVSRALGQASRGQVRKSDYPNQLDYMSQRSLDLLGKNTFGDRWGTLSEDEKLEFSQIVSGGKGALEAMGKVENGSAWDSMTSQQREAYKKRVISKSNISATDEFSHESIQRYLAKRYGRNEAQRFERATHNFAYKSKGNKKGETSVDVWNPELYKSLEKQNIAGRIGELKNATPGSPEEEERRIYQKMALAMELDMKKVKNKVEELELAIESETDPTVKRELELELDDSREVLTVLGRGAFMRRVGEWEGYMNSLKNVWGPGGSNVALSIINGNFFDKRKNQVFNPVEEKKVGGVGIYIAKKEGKGLTLQYNAMGEQLYYMTPRSIFRTIFYNGEGFARLAYKRVDSIDFLGKGKDEFIESFMSTDIKDLDAFISKSLLAIRGSNKQLTGEQIENLKKILNSSKNLRKIANTFSMPFRIQEKLKGYFTARLKKQRERFKEFLLKNARLRQWLLDTGADKLLTKWVAGGGIRVLVQSLVQAVVGGLGLTFGPVASVVVTVITGVAMDLIMKILKYSLAIFKYALIGFVALFFVIGFFAKAEVSKFNKRNYAYSNAVPASVIQCGAYEEEPIEGNPITPGDFDTQCTNGQTIEEIYDSVASSMGLGTQLELVSCPGHPMCDNIAWAWCYSADKIYCRGDKLSTVLYDCSILERLFIHELIHQVQSINGAPYDADLREWGADFLSGNGGSYMFTTQDGCKRATEIRVPESCDQKTLTAIAYAEAWAYATECKNALRSYIISRFCN